MDRIYGGEELPLEESIPWQVSIRQPPGNGHVCGGVIINEKTILTAAHCFFDDNGKRKNYPDNEYTVIAGSNQLKPTLPKVRRFCYLSEFAVCKISVGKASIHM